MEINLFNLIQLLQFVEGKVNDGKELNETWRVLHNFSLHWVKLITVASFKI